MAKEILEESGLFGLHLPPQYCSPLKEVRIGAQTGQNPGDRSRCRGMEG